MAHLQQPQILAILFVEAGVSADCPVGPFSTFGPCTLLDQQLSVLVASGIQDVALLSDFVAPMIEETMLHWRERGLHIAAFSDRSALAEWTKKSASLLILGHNVLATPATIAHAAGQERPILFVRDAATSDDRHERIDLNDRWTGIAVLPSAYLNNLPQLAEDWSLQSALLRHAVQNGVPRETMAIGPSATLQSEIIVDAGDIERWQGRTVQQHFDQENTTATPFRRWISLPLARTMMPLLWDSRAEAAQIVAWGRYALMVIVFILALLQWPIAALGLLIPVLLLEEVSRQNSALSVRVTDDALLAKVYSGAWFALPAVALMSSGVTSQLNAFLIGGTAALSVAVSAAARPMSEKWVIARDEAVVLTLGCAIAGLSLTSAGLLTSFAVLICGFWRPIWSRLNAI